MSDGMLFVDARTEARHVREHTVDELRDLYREVRDFMRLVEIAKRMDQRTAETTYTQYGHSRFQELSRMFRPINQKLKYIDSEAMRRSRNWILESFSNALTVKRKASLVAKMSIVVSNLHAIMENIQGIGVDIQIKEI
ncbi:hypothetical protein [Stenotrophomonas sp. SG1]|uniref:hypothetical protein n=1 Tax=Stenotrophomonas sp. SG1 TaxID=2944932 RepID=UPI001658BE2C|nr:hypothetical protein [Stenotrophomonas sp. SG1]MBC9081565.1 hypothetical protein [Stenotrophomonas maltophilia]MCW8340619.1 hypothetical protein [Stenotrophomonas sp. SG1]